MTPTSRSLCLLLLGGSILGLSRISEAAPTPISLISATATSEFTGRTASDTVGGFNFTTGLSAGSGLVDADTGLVFPQHSNNPGTMWLTNNVQPGEITFDLGSAVILDRAWLYNYNENSNNPALFTQRGIQTTGSVSTSLDGIVFTPQPALSNFTLNPADGLNTYDTPDVVLFGGIQAQHVRFSNLTHFPGGDQNFVGLSEAIFFSIPEPSRALLLLVGCGVLGLRRRRLCL